MRVELPECRHRAHARHSPTRARTHAIRPADIIISRDTRSARFATTLARYIIVVRPTDTVRCSAARRTGKLPEATRHGHQVQVRNHRDGVRSVHVIDHVPTAGGQLLQSKNNYYDVHIERGLICNACRGQWRIYRNFSRRRPG